MSNIFSTPYFSVKKHCLKCACSHRGKVGVGQHIICLSGDYLNSDFFLEFLSDTTRLFLEFRWQSYDNSSNTFVFSYVETQDFDKLDLPLLFFSPSSYNTNTTKRWSFCVAVLSSLTAPFIH